MCLPGGVATRPFQNVVSQCTSVDLSAITSSDSSCSRARLINQWNISRDSHRQASALQDTHEDQVGFRLRSSPLLRWQRQRTQQHISCELGDRGNGSAIPHGSSGTDASQWPGDEPRQNGDAYERKSAREPRQGSNDKQEGFRGGKAQKRAAEKEGEPPYRIVEGKKIYIDELDVLALLDENTRLQPLDPSYNAAAYLWKKIGDIPLERRHRLLDVLLPRHIRNLWEVAGTRYFDEELFVEDTSDMLPDVRMNDLLDAEVWNGRVIGLPAPLGWLSRFQKAFFVGNDETVYGRVLSGGPLLAGVADVVAPLYFQVQLAETVRATGQRCDASFVYEDGQQQLRDGGLPPGFPPPKGHVWPFSDGMKDYLRPAGPGVLVGQSWRDGRESTSSPKQFLGEFVLIRHYNVEPVDEDA